MKLKKSLLVIIVLCLIFLLFFSNQLPFNFGAIYNPSGVPMSIQSITAFNQNGNPITLISNDAELQTITFRGTAVVGDVGNDSFTAENVGASLTNTNLNYKNTVKFIVTRVNDVYVFPIYSSSSSDEIYNYNLQRIDPSITNPFPSCPNSATWKINSGLFGLTKYCVTKIPYGSKLNIGTPVYRNNVEMRMNVFENGVLKFSQDALIDNYDQKSKEFRSSNNK